MTREEHYLNRQKEFLLKNKVKPGDKFILEGAAEPRSFGWSNTPAVVST